ALALPLRIALLLGFALLPNAVSAGSAPAADVPSLESPSLARGAFSSMRMLLEKTFLKIDVATIDVRVGKRTQAELARLGTGRQYSPAVEPEMAKAVLQADSALIQLAFLRDVPLGRWIDGVRESLASAGRAKWVDAALQRRVSDGLPVWFKAIEADGFHEGDRILYEIRPGSLRTLVVTRAGQVLVDRVDKGGDIPRVVLASYFAPGTDYRSLLLESLFVRR
ncbi:MAG TPA: hypothetical protein VMG12_24400, partial [Polyangiaceae bacterium]|nr:hypothetical protein [Polyangiaceae bacterium]